jgi:hypothetical protein
MNNLALAYVACDKYSFVWDEWYEAFLEYWDIPIKRYFCGETKSPGWYGWNEMPHEAVPADKWTTKLREQVEGIPEEYIFVWLDDGILLMNISKVFTQLYSWLYSKGGDSMRIMYRETRATYKPVDYLDGKPISKLTRDSRYRVSFSPNIYKRDFLLEVLSKDESPWSCELNSRGMFANRNLYAYHIHGWFLNKIIQ